MSTPNDKHNIVMFRLKTETLRNMGEVLTREPIIGVRSTNQFARKIVKDFMEGRLVYTNPKFSLADTELLDSEAQDASS